MSLPAAGTQPPTEGKRGEGLCAFVQVVLSDQNTSRSLQSIPAKFYWFPGHTSLMFRNEYSHGSPAILLTSALATLLCRADLSFRSGFTQLLLPDPAVVCDACSHAARGLRNATAPCLIAGHGMRSRLSFAG